MDENSLVVSLHKFTGCSIVECRKALSLAMQYLKLRHPIGDHPEEASKHEYELVPKDYITKSEQWLKELTEYKQLNKPCVVHLPRCRDCKYFEYDSFAKVDGIPLIIAHEICSKWGNGCKTMEDGYCFLFKPKEKKEEESEE